MDPYARERGFLSGLAAGTRHGRGAAVVVCGDPGAGQEELLRSASSQAAGTDLCELRGSPRERGLHLGALPDLLRPLTVWLDVLPPGQRDAVVATAAGAQDASHELLGPACVGLLAEAARHRPQLVCVHDTHWLDPASFDTLTYVARHARSFALGVVIGMDTGTHGRELAGLDVLALRPLSIDESVAVLTAQCPGIAPPVARDLATAAGGNLDALRRLADVLPAGVIRGSEPLPDPLPIDDGPLARALDARLATLPADTRKALLVVALAPRGLVTTLTAALRNLDLGIGHLQPAEAAGLLRIQTGRITAPHPLLWPLVAARATPALRRGAHHALAEASPPRDRWRHLMAAATGPDPDMVRRLTAAAHGATARWQFEQAASAHVCVARLAAAGDERHDSLCAAAQAELLAGDPFRALTLLNDATDTAGEESAQAHAHRLRSAALAGTGHLRAAQILLEPAPSPDRQDHPVGADASVLVALLRLVRGELPAARTLLAEVAASGRAPRGCSGLHALVCALGGDRAASAAALAGPEGAGGVLAPLHRLLEGHSLLVAERHDDAYRVLTATAARSREPEATSVLIACDLGLAALDIRIGHWRSATDRATEAVLLASHPPQPVLLASAYGLLARAEADRGEVHVAARHAQQALELAHDADARLLVPPALHAIGTLALSLGESEQAVAALQEAGELLAAAGINDPRFVPWAPDLVEAAIRNGSPALARTALATLEDHARTTGSRWARGVALRCRALLTGTGAAEEFAGALDVQMTLDSPYEIARTELAFGQRLRRDRRRAKAQALLRRASTRFAGLGGRAWAELAAAELRAAGGAAWPPDAESRPVPDLTHQEQRVARLVVDGASNRQVGAHLYLSPKTVENHLSRIYAKLGVSNRTQLAHVLRAPGLPQAAGTRESPSAASRPPLATDGVVR